MIRDPKAIIYSDSDGVICDFYAGAEKALGHPFNSGHLSKSDQGRIINEHKGFWATLPPMPDLKVYWDFIEKYHPHILTAVPGWDHNFSEVVEGKREWYRRNIPSLPTSRIHVVRRQNKSKFATSGNVRNILIDDYEENVRAFEHEGGIGIHHINAKVTILKLKDLGYY